MVVLGQDGRYSSNEKFVLKGTSNAGSFSGVLISQDLVISNEHVIGGNLRFNGILADVVFKDSYLDIAFFQLRRALDITPVKLKTPHQPGLNVGNRAIGYSFDFPGQSTDSNEFTNIVKNRIQTKLDMEQGASGGAILDFKGDLVGIISKETASFNIATAISDDMIDAAQYYDDLKGLSYISKYNVEDNEEEESSDLGIRRFLNVQTHHHLYTSDSTVADDLASSDLFREESFSIKDSGEFDLYALWNTTTKSYFYTRSITEYNYIRHNLSNFENYFEESFSVDENELYRLYNPNSGYHFYTDSEFERDYLVDVVGFNDEGFV